MPLQLGGVETERPQLITWNPNVHQEAHEARARREKLLAMGYVLAEEAPGEVKLHPPPKGPNIGVFRVLSQNGDDRITWDRTVPAQVKEAYKKFKELVAKGYKAYAVKRDGRKGHKIIDFDPLLEEILLVPATMPG